MNNASFLVALFALLQIAAGSRTLAQERFPEGARPSVEDSLELDGQDVAREIEAILQQLDHSADKIGHQFERWAEDNSAQLDAWSKKYAPQWESWGDRFVKEFDRLAADQEDVWGRWAQGYEKNLERWTSELESSELAPGQVGEFVKQNLKSLGKMPLGQLVDQALDVGLGQLNEAPWESLEELGELAKNALEEPRSGLSNLFKENDAERGDRALEFKPRIDLPPTNPIRDKVERENKLQLRQELLLPGQDIHRESIRNSDQKSKQLDARLPKRPDGKRLEGSQKTPPLSQRDSTPQFQRDGRDGKANRKPAANNNRSSAEKTGTEARSELEVLREEITRLRLEVQELKKQSDK